MTDMTTGKFLTVQSLAMIVGIVGSVIGVAWAFDRRTEERVAVVNAEVRRVDDNSVNRREYVDLRAEVRASRERLDSVAQDIAAIKALMEERLPERRRR